MIENAQSIEDRNKPGCLPFSRMLARIFSARRKEAPMTLRGRSNPDYLQLLLTPPAEILFEPAGIAENARDTMIRSLFLQMIYAVRPGADANMDNFYAQPLEAAVDIDLPQNHAQNMRTLLGGLTVGEIVSHGVTNVEAGNIWLKSNSAIHSSRFELPEDMLCRYVQPDAAMMTTSEGIGSDARMIPIVINSRHVIWQDIHDDLVAKEEAQSSSLLHPAEPDAADGIKQILPGFSDVSDIICAILVAEYQFEAARHIGEPLINQNTHQLI